MWLGLAALVVAVVSICWTISQDRRLRALETGSQLRVVPGKHLHWARHHQDASIVEDILVHLTNTGAVGSVPVSVIAVIDDEEAGESPLVSVPAKATADARIRLDWKRRGTRHPKPVGDGDLALRVITGPDGTQLVARYPLPRGRWQNARELLRRLTVLTAN